MGITQALSPHRHMVIRCIFYPVIGFFVNSEQSPASFETPFKRNWIETLLDWTKCFILIWDFFWYKGIIYKREKWHKLKVILNWKLKRLIIKNAEMGQRFQLRQTIYSWSTFRRRFKCIRNDFANGILISKELQFPIQKRKKKKL